MIFPPNGSSVLHKSFKNLSIVSNTCFDVIDISSQVIIRTFLSCSPCFDEGWILQVDFSLTFRGNLNVECSVLPLINKLAVIPVHATVKNDIFLEISQLKEYSACSLLLMRRNHFTLCSSFAL